MGENHTVPAGISVARHLLHAPQVSDLHAMEGLVLQTLDFRLNSPTAHTFLSIFSEGVGLQGRAAALASMYTVSGHLQCSAHAALPGQHECSESCKPLGQLSAHATIGTGCCAAFHGALDRDPGVGQQGLGATLALCLPCIGTCIAAGIVKEEDRPAGTGSYARGLEWGL